MAIGSVYLTKRGRNLLAKAVAGANLTFTRFAIGDAYLNGAAIEDLNNVISFKYSVGFSKKQFNEVGKVKLAGNFTNSDVGGFYYRELGLFATDPDLGEILYAYGNADSRAEYIPVSTEEIYEKTIVLNAYISNAASVTAVIDESLVFATVEELTVFDTAIKQNTQKIDELQGIVETSIPKVTGAGSGNMAQFNATGGIEDSGLKFSIYNGGLRVTYDDGL